MTSLIIIIIIACGFWFTENDYRAQVYQAQHSGWKVYSHIALYGCLFILCGFLFIFIAVYLPLYLISQSLSVFVCKNEICQPAINLYSWLTENQFLGQPLFLFLSLLATGGFTWCKVTEARKLMDNYHYRLTQYKKLASKNELEKLFIQSLEKGNQIFITLKSRKVYIGYLTAPRIDFATSGYLSLIPSMSGYREKDTLSFIEQNYYDELYKKQKISNNTAPLNLESFRKIIPLDQIETASLFDTDTYLVFDLANEQREELCKY